MSVAHYLHNNTDLYDYLLNERELVILDNNNLTIVRTDNREKMARFFQFLPTCDSQLDWYLSQWYNEIKNQKAIDTAQWKRRMKV